MGSSFKSICIPALMLLVSCSSQYVEDSVGRVYLRVENLECETSIDTKSSIVIDGAPKFYWKDTDEVGIFPDKGGYQLGFSLAGQGCKETGAFDGGGWALRTDAKYSTYYPFRFENRSPERIPLSYTGQVQNGPNSTEHLGNWYFCATEPTSAVNGNVSFELKNLGGLIWFAVTVPDAGTYTEISLVTDSNLFTSEGYYNLKNFRSGDDDSMHITPTRKTSRISLSLDNVATTSENQVINAYMMAAPFDITGHPYKLYVKTDAGLYYSADLSAKSHVLKRNGSRKIAVTVSASDGYNVGVDDWDSGESLGGDAE